MMLSSKFTFLLIAIAALFASGSGIMAQDAYAREDPTFTAAHINTTATKLSFDFNLNGTLRVLDWSLKASSTAVAGSPLTEVTITNIVNGTTSGITSDGNDSYSSLATAKNKLDSGVQAAPHSRENIEYFFKVLKDYNINIKKNSGQ